MAVTVKQRIYCPNNDILDKIRKNYTTNGVLDFNKIIPMPDSIKLTTSPVYNESCVFVLARSNRELENLDKNLNDFVESLNLNTTPKPEIIDDIKHTVNKAYYDRPNLARIEENILKDDNFKKYCLKNNLLPNRENYGKQILENFLKYETRDWYEWTFRYWGAYCNTKATDWEYGDSKIQPYFEYETQWGLASNTTRILSEILNTSLISIFTSETFAKESGIVQFTKGCLDFYKKFEDESLEAFIISSILDDPKQKKYKYSKNKGILTESKCKTAEDLKEFRNTKELSYGLIELTRFYQNLKEE